MSELPEQLYGSHLPYFNFEIASTPNCNMACTYCFEGDELKSKSKQKQENIPKIQEKISALLNDKQFQKEYGGITLNFWGGEPTINYNWNRDLIEAIRNPENKIDQSKIKYFIYSNGYSYSKVTQHLDLFTKEEREQGVLRIQISWDGIEGLRVDHSQKQTLDIIRKNILRIVKNYPELQGSTKATIQPEELLKLNTVWDAFYQLFLEVHPLNSNFQINFSPTLNYVDDYHTTPEYLEAINQQFIEVAQKELFFYKRYRHHLFSWFGGNTEQDFLNKRATNCSAGVHILAMDIEGNVSPCHGTLYSPLKKNFMSLPDTNGLTDSNQKFIESVHKMRFSLKPELNRFDESCTNCDATVCYKCPIVNVEQKAQADGNKFGNLKEIDIVKDFQSRDTRHCQIYKTFGPIDRALFKLKQNYEQTK